MAEWRISDISKINGEVLIPQIESYLGYPIVDIYSFRGDVLTIPVDISDLDFTGVDSIINTHIAGYVTPMETDGNELQLAKVQSNILALESLGRTETDTYTILLEQRDNLLNDM